MQTKLGSTLPERIGNTPLVRLDQIAGNLPGIALLGKAEWANPGGSAMDRAAASMVADARARGLLAPGKVLLDAVIGKDGSVEQLRVVSGPAELQQSALDAVKQWKYKPFLLNGDPIEVKTNITIVYTLAK